MGYIKSAIILTLLLAQWFTAGVHAESKGEPKTYHEQLNPSQKEYANHLGFNDLHIQAIRHVRPNGDNTRLDIVVHHHCKAYDDGTLTCLLFPTGMNDQDKPHGIEYIITAAQYAELTKKEQKYWHYHKTEIPRAKADLPDMTPSQAAANLPAINETYGKVIYFWQLGDKYPVGDPDVLVVQDLPEDY